MLKFLYLEFLKFLIKQMVRHKEQQKKYKNAGRHQKKGFEK